MVQNRPDLHGRSHDSTRQLLHRLETLVSQLPLPAAARLQIGDAAAVMLHAHEQQPNRMDGQAYVTHPLEVALTVITELRVTRPEVIIAALLHDTVEDQAPRLLQLLGAPPAPPDRQETAALAALGRAFGPRVAELVGRLTNPDFAALQAAAEANGRFPTQYDLYHDHIAALFAQDPDAFVVKLADLSQNALKLHQLPPGPRKEHLQRKYGPVIQFVIRALTDLADPTHPLFRARAALLDQFTAADKSG